MNSKNHKSFMNPIMYLVLGILIGLEPLRNNILGPIVVLLGILATLKGAYHLQMENEYFAKVWKYARIFTVFAVFKAIFLSTVLHDTPWGNILYYVLKIILGLLSLVLILYTYRGLDNINQSFQENERVADIKTILPGYIAIFSLSFYEGKNLIIIIAIYVLYTFFVVKLIQYAESISTKSRAMPNDEANKSKTNKMLIITALTLIVGISLGFIFARKYPMDWQKLSLENNTEFQSIRDKLISEGMDEYIVEDLSDEDLSLFMGSNLSLKSIDSVKTPPAIVVKSFAFTNPDGSVRMLHHVNYEIFERGSRAIISESFINDYVGTEAVKILPNTLAKHGELEVEDIIGKVIYSDSKGKYVSKFNALYFASQREDEVVSLGSAKVLKNKLVIGTFLRPTKVDGMSFYISYKMNDKDADRIRSSVSIVHQKHNFHYPKQTANKVSFGKEDDTYNFEILEYYQDYIK